MGHRRLRGGEVRGRARGQHRQQLRLERLADRQVRSVRRQPRPGRRLALARLRGRQRRRGVGPRRQRRRALVRPGLAQRLLIRGRAGEAPHGVGEAGVRDSLALGFGSSGALQRNCIGPVVAGDTGGGRGGLALGCGRLRALQGNCLWPVAAGELGGVLVAHSPRGGVRVLCGEVDLRVGLALGVGCDGRSQGPPRPHHRPHHREGEPLDVEGLEHRDGLGFVPLQGEGRRRALHTLGQQRGRPRLRHLPHRRRAALTGRVSDPLKAPRRFAGRVASRVARLVLPVGPLLALELGCCGVVRGGAGPPGASQPGILGGAPAHYPVLGFDPHGHLRRPQRHRVVRQLWDGRRVLAAVFLAVAGLGLHCRRHRRDVVAGACRGGHDHRCRDEAALARRLVPLAMLVRLGRDRLQLFPEPPAHLGDRGVHSAARQRRPLQPDVWVGAGLHQSGRRPSECLSEPPPVALPAAHVGQDPRRLRHKRRALRAVGHDQRDSHLDRRARNRHRPDLGGGLPEHLQKPLQQPAECRAGANSGARGQAVRTGHRVQRVDLGRHGSAARKRLPHHAVHDQRLQREGRQEGARHEQARAGPVQGTRVHAEGRRGCAASGGERQGDGQSGVDVCGEADVWDGEERSRARGGLREAYGQEQGQGPDRNDEVRAHGPPTPGGWQRASCAHKDPGEGQGRAPSAARRGYPEDQRQSERGRGDGRRGRRVS
mmetsp:Transcript_64804/g.187845  ORF Transcript_64804/g.187845 Transcript_64804/m.187845 type:complete len:713 (+) Transcript_64804:1251-3389(+)